MVSRDSPVYLGHASQRQIFWIYKAIFTGQMLLGCPTNTEGNNSSKSVYHINNLNLLNLHTMLNMFKNSKSNLNEKRSLVGLSLGLFLHEYFWKLASTLLKSGGGFLPLQRLDKHQMAFLIIDILPDFCNSLQQAKHTAMHTPVYIQLSDSPI